MPRIVSNGRLLTTRRVLPNKTGTVLALSGKRAICLSRGTSKQRLRLTNGRVRVSSAALGCDTTSKRIILSTLTCGGIRIPQNNRCALILGSNAGMRLGSVDDLHFPLTFRTKGQRIRLTKRTCFRMGGANRPFVMSARNVRVRILKAAFGVSTCPNRRCRTALIDNSIGISAKRKRDLILGPSRRTSLVPKDKGVRIHAMSATFCAS